MHCAAANGRNHMTDSIDEIVDITIAQHDIAQKAADIFRAHPPMRLYEAVQAATGWKHITDDNRDEFNLLFWATQLIAQKDNRNHDR